MGDPFTERRRRDLANKAGALRDELRRWRGISAAGQPLEKHQTQLGRITARMDGLLERIQQVELAEAEVLDKGRALEQKLLTAHTIWEFFRAKFAQRLDPGYGAHLRVCDDFAWQCYSPVQLMFHARPENAERVSATREPPLVYLNGGWSPLAIGRSSAFQVERAAGGWSAHEDFREVIEDLPVPLVGLPWFHVAHLPDVLVIAHEVGHVVEWDFRLRPDLEAALARSVEPARLQAWTAWLPEVFADIYGCLAGGAAFAATLIDFLVQGRERLLADRRNPGAWGHYPPAWLRTRLLVETLSTLADGDEMRQTVEMLAQRQEQYFGRPEANLDFAGDPPVVAAAMLDCRCSTLLNAAGAAPRVRDLLPGSGPLAGHVAGNIARGNKSGSEDLPVLLAAARWVWERDPLAYVDKGFDARIRALLPLPKPGTRGPLRTEPTPAEEALREQREKVRGGQWFEALFADPP